MHHLADSEMRSAVRLRQLLAEDRPVIQAYDQEDYARRLFYDRPIDASLEVFRAARASTAELLDRLSSDDWRREGSHPEHGAYTVERWLEIYADHAHNHATQIRRARARRGVIFFKTARGAPPPLAHALRAAPFGLARRSASAGCLPRTARGAPPDMPTSTFPRRAGRGASRPRVMFRSRSRGPTRAPPPLKLRRTAVALRESGHSRASPGVRRV